MTIITKQMLIENVAEAWHKTYPESSPYGRDKQEIYERLKALPATASEKDIADIIGNYSWTSLLCSECGMHVDAVVEVGEPPDYESHTASLCFNCIDKMYFNIKILKNF